MWSLGALVRLIVPGHQTGGRLAVLEHVSPAGTELPPHIHQREEVILHVMQGIVTVVVGDDVIRAVPGTTLLLPRGVLHAHRVETPSARLLAMVTPAGFEKFFADVGQPAKTPKPPPPTPPPDPDWLAAALDRYAVRLQLPASDPAPAPEVLNPP